VTVSVSWFSLVLGSLCADKYILIVILNTIKGITRGDVSSFSLNHRLHAESRFSGKYWS
jgi:hypothetical protein